MIDIVLTAILQSSNCQVFETSNAWSTSWTVVAQKTVCKAPVSKTVKRDKKKGLAARSKKLFNKKYVKTTHKTVTVSAPGVKNFQVHKNEIFEVSGFTLKLSSANPVRVEYIHAPGW